MLEETLKSINSNLERVAKALEDSNYLYRKCVMKDTEVNIKEEKESTVIQMTPETNSSITVGQAYATNQPQPVLQETPVTAATPQPVTVVTQQPVQQPAATIPTTQVENSFTQEQLAVAMSNAVSAGKMNTVVGILQQFGVQALTQIDPKDYNKVATMLMEAGVKV